MDDQTAWDLYFSGLVGWTLHPGYFRENAEKLNLDQIADLVDKMMYIRSQRCLGSSAEQ